ncbi:hypothetical protein PPO74_10090, partial [Neisseria gonorrhoeae]
MNIKHLLLTAAATALLGISAPALAHHDGHGDDDHGHAAHQHGKQDKIISRPAPRPTPEGGGGPPPPPPPPPPPR